MEPKLYFSGFHNLPFFLIAHYTRTGHHESFAKIGIRIMDESEPSSRTTAAVVHGQIRYPRKQWISFLAGAVGGMAGTTLTAPFDVVKTRLQSDLYATKDVPRGLGVSGKVRETLRLLGYSSECQRSNC
jgi:hypothetical protein